MLLPYRRIFPRRILRIVQVDGNMRDALAVDLVKIVLAAVVLFYVILPLWAAWDWIAWGFWRGTVPVIASAVVHHIAVANGIQPVPAVAAALNKNRRSPGFAGVAVAV
jgi:hypothetical protein